MTLTLVDRVADAARSGLTRLESRAGGPARTRVVVMLALVLALDAADRGAVGAVAPQLEAGLRIGNWQIGLMVTVSSLVAAAATVPMGVLVDNRHRIRLLTGCIVVWAAAEVMSGLAPDFDLLIASRVLLGTAAAVAGPAVASLTGDFVTPGERGRVLSLILSGEVLGTGVGILYAGMFGSLLTWRATFFALAVPSLAVAFLLHRYLPEPARGGASRLREGARRIPATDGASDEPNGPPTDDPGPAPGSRAQDIVTGRGVDPAGGTVLRTDPRRLDLADAVRYLLRIRTNVILIIASSLGYFFLAGLETFAIIFLRGQYGLDHLEATLLVLVVGIGIIIGFLGAGRIGDRWMAAGFLERRISIGVVGFALSALALAAALSSSSLAVAAPLFIVAGVALAAPNPGLDAARLDVVPANMWGRSEAVRTMLRQSLEGLAPLAFGLASVGFGAVSGGIGSAAGANSGTTVITTTETRALEYTFLVMLVPLLASAVVLSRARRTYARDVASALESERYGRGGEHAG